MPKRLNIILSDAMFSELQKLDEALELSKRSETIKRALRLWELATQSKDTPVFAFKSDSELRELIVPSMPNRLPPISQATSITPPSLVTPTPGFHIGVFGESSEPDRIVEVTDVLASFGGTILHSAEDLSRLKPAQFEALVLDRLVTMGYEAVLAGNTFQADGGIDIIFKSKPGKQLPVMGAVQVKHRINPQQPIGPRVVRELAGALSQQFRGQFNLAMVVTNTFFTQAAQDFIKSPEVFLRLKDGDDLMRWVKGDFGTQEEFRGFPNEIELTTRLILSLNSRKPK